MGLGPAHDNERSPYDAVAEFYNRAWADWYLPSIRPFLERYLLCELPAGASVLDVCCGCGHVTAAVTAAGFRVTGIDASEGLIQRARRNVPAATFVKADARGFRLGERFEGALSTFDSLNHMLTYDDLCAAFRSVKRALSDGAPFVFDMNLEEAYTMDLGAWTRYHDEDATGFVRGRYDLQSKRGRTELVWFERAGREELWRRSEATVEEQCYSKDEINEAIKEARFASVEYYSDREAGVTDELGYGRLYARAWA